MATIASISSSPANPVPAGQSATITVAFNTNPAQAQLDADCTGVFNNGQPGTVHVTLAAIPAEATPDMQVGSTGTGWEIRTTAGVLRRTAQNTFTLSRT